MNDVAINEPVHIYGPTFSTLVRSVMLCCEEKGVPYTVGTEFNGMDLKAVRAEHPFGRIPVLLHGERRLFETAPICRYLDAEFSGVELQPSDNLHRAAVDQWTQALTCYVDEAIVRKYLLEFAFPQGEGGAVREVAVAENTPRLLEVLGVIENQLGGQDFFCGDQFSTADALLIPMLDYLLALPTAAHVFATAPKSESYTRRMRQRQSCSRVLLGFDGAPVSQ